MRSIIDAHFTENYKYYESICRFQFGGNYLYQDLLQETYLALTQVKSETIEFYNEIGKLNCIVIRIIKALYGRRKNDKRNANGSTSPLYEIPSVDSRLVVFALRETDDFMNLAPLDKIPDDSLNPLELAIQEETIQRQFEQANDLIKIALQEPVIETKGTEISNYLKVRVFTEVLNSNVNQVHKSTGISRAYLTRINREGQQYLQNKIK